VAAPMQPDVQATRLKTAAPSFTRVVSQLPRRQQDACLLAVSFIASREEGMRSTVFRDKGFTLVELAIVITIIGLLIGGVLKGQEMIQNARITATIAQVDSFRAATHTFRDRFDNLPGDMPVARTRLPGCSDASFCYNGNGNNRIGTGPNPPTAGWYNSGGAATAVIGDETTQFWKHLAMADLISGVNPGASAVAMGQSHPTSPFASTFAVNFAGTSYGAPKAHMFLLRRTARASSGDCPVLETDISGQQAFCAVAPMYAAIIDRKTDAGRARTGYVQSVSAWWINGCGNPDTNNQGSSGYDETKKTFACDMGFALD
jgi:prepilin-type N-terminal cleavage/methylation domain-containing protein